MGTLKSKLVRAVSGMISKITGGLAQDEGRAGDFGTEVFPGMPKLIRELGAEGTVLLKNDGVLPFSEGQTVSVFGRVQRDYFCVGYGSGGDVKAPYKTDFLTAAENAGVRINQSLASIYKKWCEENPVDHGYWGHWPRHYPEMPLSEETAKNAAKCSDAAVVVIGRVSGEDREHNLEKGSYYLTDEEERMLTLICENFSSVVVVLNIGSIMDMSWTEGYGEKIGAIVIPWQGGMEAGNALVDVLWGKQVPSGKLTDTVARDYSDYPCAADFGGQYINNYTEDIYVGYRYFETFAKAKDKVLYPFGYGLGYTDFAIENQEVMFDGSRVSMKIKVTNIGERFSGKETVQVYCSAPQGALGKADRVLAAFAKTQLLLPKESQILELSFDLYAVASYDDSGRSGERFSYVLEGGCYRVFVGTSVRDTEEILEFTLEKTVLKRLAQAAAPKQAFDRMIAKTENGILTPSTEKTPINQVDLRKRIVDGLPKDIPYAGDKGYKLADVKSGRVSMDDFVSQLSLTELEAISRGDYVMNSPLGAKGNAGVFGGVTESLREKGIAPVVTTDGPSGIRLLSVSSLLPIGAVLACSWNTEAVENLYKKLASEMKQKGSDVLLAPGMNIHRSPLCGRNFEYFSEDPIVSGKIAAAVVKGLQSEGISACPKHFACNNQETNRSRNDSRVSERALREIYLKGFEICVKEANPYNIMTSYNKINGVWGHYHHDLCTTILRGEWGYRGNVMTDWWMKPSKSLEFPIIEDNAYRVRAQVDVLMPGGKHFGRKKPDGTLLKSHGKDGGITLGEMQRSAANVLNFVMQSHSFMKAYGKAEEKK